MPREKSYPELSLSDFLIAEYEHISRTVDVKADDEIPRSVINFDIATFGAIVASVISDKLNIDAKSISLINFVFMLFFLWLFFRGITTVIQIARTRLAWYEATLALNQIKDFFIRQFPGSERATRWTTATLPPKYKIRSVSFFFVLQVSVLSSFAFGASAGLFGLLLGLKSAFWFYLISVTLGVLSFCAHLVIYKRMLN